MKELWGEHIVEMALKISSSINFHDGAALGKLIQVPACNLKSLLLDGKLLISWIMEIQLRSFLVFLLLNPPTLLQSLREGRIERATHIRTK